MSHQKLVVAAVIVDDLDRPRRVLAARRSRPPHLAGQWEFPGGKVETGELPTDALRRELVEELQIDVAIGDELTGPHDGVWPITTDIVMRVWWTKIIGGHPTPTDSHDDVRWLPIGRLLELSWLPADQAIVDLIRS